MFLIRIYLRERPGTRDLRKLMHAAGTREAMKISARSFSPSVTYAVSRNRLPYCAHYAAWNGLAGRKGGGRGGPR